MREPIAANLRQSVLLRDRHRCVICASVEDLAIDHVHPVAEGGVSRIENLQTLCKPCNTSKLARDGHEWLSSGMWRRRWKPKPKRGQKPSEPGNPLRDWLAENGQTIAQFEERCGLTKSYLSRLMNAERDAPASTIAKIWAATDGAVTPDAWIAWWQARDAA